MLHATVKVCRGLWEKVCEHGLTWIKPSFFSRSAVGRRNEGLIHAKWSRFHVAGRRSIDRRQADLGGGSITDAWTHLRQPTNRFTFVTLHITFCVTWFKPSAEVFTL